MLYLENPESLAMLPAKGRGMGMGVVVTLRSVGEPNPLPDGTLLATMKRRVGYFVANIFRDKQV
jgi:hypothetical protein